MTFGELSHHSMESRLILREANRSDTAPYIKASIRDIKVYRDSKKYRKIPVGYSAGTCLHNWLHFVEDVIMPCSRSLVLFPSFHSRLSAWVVQSCYFDFGAKIGRCYSRHMLDGFILICRVLVTFYHHQTGKSICRRASYSNIL